MDIVIGVVIVLCIGGFLYVLKSKHPKAPKDPGGNGAGGQDSELN